MFVVKMWRRINRTDFFIVKKLIQVKEIQIRYPITSITDILEIPKETANLSKVMVICGFKIV